MSLVSFEKWWIDYIGKIYLNSSSGKKYIIVATEYLTKWAEAKVVITNDAKTIANFLFKLIIIWFGYLKILINDRGQHFLKKVIEGVTKRFKINDRKTTPYNLQTNGSCKYLVENRGGLKMRLGY